MNQPVMYQEHARLDALASLKIINTPRENCYDDFASIASTICDMPFAAISLIDDCKVWFKARINIDASELPREIGFCSHTLKSPEPFIIYDLLQDERFKSNPLVTTPGGFRFYGGFPLVSQTGIIFGAVCILDNQPRDLSEKQINSMKAISRAIVAQLEMRMTYFRITEQEQLILEQKETLESIVNNIPVSITVLDRELNGEWNNAESSRLFDWRHENSFSNFFGSSEDLRTAFQHMIQATGQWKDFSTRLRNGNFSPVAWSIVKLSSGKRVAFGQDISVRKKQEAMIEEQKIKMVQTARLSSLGEMAGGIAHEINNPLAIIRGTVQIMARNIERGEIDMQLFQKHVKRVDDTVVRIAKIISGLRSFAHDGEHDPMIRNSMKGILTETLDLCQSRFRDNGIELNIQVPQEDIFIECRSVQISQVLINLLNNAFDAVAKLDEKWVSVRLELKRGFVVFEVSDSGKEIPQSIRQKIMEPFFTTKDPGKGTGLGLSLSSSIIQGHGGLLELKNDSTNTCFSVSLPVKKAA